MPIFKRIGGGPWKNGQKSDDLTWNDPRPSVPAPAIYAGDVNCQHTDWGYKQTTKDGETLSDWASSAEELLLYDPKEPPSFFSARWNTYTNPDLAFAVGRSCDPKPERRIIYRFPRSHHRPSIITKSHRWFSR